MLEYSSSQQSKDQKHESGSALFKKQKGAILVTSDALTRGMDMPGVELVINYDTPTYPKTYVHRAGRTARAGNEGDWTWPSLLYASLIYCLKNKLQHKELDVTKLFQPSSKSRLSYVTFPFVVRLVGFYFAVP